MLYEVLLTFKSVNETLVCDHSNESYRAVLSWGTVYYAVRGPSQPGIRRPFNFRTFAAGRFSEFSRREVPSRREKKNRDA